MGLALLDRHLAFYQALASDGHPPATALQAHFVAAALSQARPTTQHEVAFHHHVIGWRDPP